MDNLEQKQNFEKELLAKHSELQESQGKEFIIKEQLKNEEKLRATLEQQLTTTQQQVERQSSK